MKAPESFVRFYNDFILDLVDKSNPTKESHTINAKTGKPSGRKSAAQANFANKRTGLNNFLGKDSKSLREWLVARYDDKLKFYYDYQVNQLVDHWTISLKLLQLHFLITLIFSQEHVTGTAPTLEEEIRMYVAKTRNVDESMLNKPPTFRKQSNFNFESKGSPFNLSTVKAAIKGLKELGYHEAQ